MARGHDALRGLEQELDTARSQRRRATEEATVTDPGELGSLRCA